MNAQRWSFEILVTVETIADIRFDGNYQRDVSKVTTRKLVIDWDERLAAPVLLNRRNPSDITLWCIDGRHRIMAALEKGYMTIPAIVLEGLTPQEESDLFYKVNTDRGTMSVDQAFNAGVMSGRQDFVSVQRCLKANGLDIVRDRHKSASLGHIKAIDSLRKIFTRYGEEVLQHTLHVVIRAWPKELRPRHGVFLSGVARFLAMAHTQDFFKLDLCVRRFRQLPPEDLHQQVISDLHLHRQNYAWALDRHLRVTYNKGQNPERCLPVL